MELFLSFLIFSPHKYTLWAYKENRFAAARLAKISATRWIGKIFLFRLAQQESNTYQYEFPPIRLLLDV